MNIKISPVAFEAYDESLLMFKVEAFDEATASVKIDTLLDISMWDEISPLIRQCLVDMQLEVQGEETSV